MILSLSGSGPVACRPQPRPGAEAELCGKRSKGHPQAQVVGSPSACGTYRLWLCDHVDRNLAGPVLPSTNTLPASSSKHCHYPPYHPRRP